MKIKKTEFIGLKITKELKNKLDKACEVMPGMYISAFIESAIEDKIRKVING